MNENNFKSINKHRKGNFLWEVKGGNAKMYLNGTVHMVPKSFFPLKDEIINSLDECRNFVLEIKDACIRDGISITNDIIHNKDYIYEDGDSLYNHFPKNKIINLRNYLVNNKLCTKEIANKFYKLKPEVVETLLSNERYNQAGLDQEHIGIDSYLMKRAMGMNKNILELETLEYQMEILDKLSITIAQKTVKKIDNKSSVNINKKFEIIKLPILERGWFSNFKIQKMSPWLLGIQAKSSGSLYNNEELIRTLRKKSISSGSPLFGNRDKEMCKKIEKFLKIKDSYFIAVGAAHLIGEGSIIDILEKKGYEIIKIC